MAEILIKLAINTNPSICLWPVPIIGKVVIVISAHGMVWMLWKEHFDSDGQQFYQYQQNKHSSLTSTHWTQKGGDITYDVGNPCPGFGQAQNYGRVKCICDKVA